MTLARRFTLLVSFTFLVVVALTGWLLTRFSAYSAEATRLASRFRTTLELNGTMRRLLAAELAAAHQAVASHDPGDERAVRELQWSVREATTRYLMLDVGDEERLGLERIRSLHAELDLALATLFETLRLPESSAAFAQIARLEGIEGELSVGLDSWSALQLKELERLLVALDATRRAAIWRAVALASGLLAMLLLLSLLFRGHVLMPLRSLEDAARRIRGGDLSARAFLRRRDEIGKLTEAFNFMAWGLEDGYRTLEDRVEARTRELKDVQGKLIQSEKLSALGELVSGVAHELNNPLTSIIGFAELQLLSARQGGDTRRVQALETMLAEAERCRRIVQSLLQFARRQEPRLERVPVNSAIQRVLDLREYELRTRNVRLVRQLDASEPVIAADPGKLQQVVLNLVNNAYDALRHAGRAGAITVRTRAEGDAVIVEVEDEGPGVAEPERVFDPFYTTKPVGEGTGLGLSVCYGIVEEHGGSIECANTGTGALFRVRLPRGRPEELVAAAAPAPETPQPSGSRTALVVDDERPLLDLQIAFLGRLGIRASGVASGDEAIRFLERTEVDLVISDVRMPGLDGPTLYGWIREHRPGLAGRFLFTSGDLARASAAVPGPAGDVPTLQKPFRFDDYSRAVRNLVAA